jgi:hypothetical protein
MKDEIILYTPDELAEHIEARVDVDKETFWLTQQQIAQLFERDRTVITKHLKNIFKEEELDEKLVCAFFAHTTQLDLQKANEQYGHFEAKTFTHSHDRFLIIDGKEVYHLGASLKDLGRKWFAFSKVETKSVESIMNAISEWI